MVQKYQNEISPILYYGISTKTNEKDLKIPNLQPPNWKSPYWMTLYILYIVLYFSTLKMPLWIRGPNFLPTADIKGQFFLVETMGLLKQKYLDTPKNICKLAKVFEPNRILHLFSEATWIKTSYKQQMWQVTPKPEEWHHQVHSWWCYETI